MPRRRNLTPAEILEEVEAVCRETPLADDGVPLPIVSMTADRLGVAMRTLQHALTRMGLRAAVAGIIRRYGHVLHAGMAKLAAEADAEAAGVYTCSPSITRKCSEMPASALTRTRA